MELYPHIKPFLASIEQKMEDELSREDKRIYGTLPDFLRLGGKRIRPALCLLSCGASGGDYQSMLEPSAIIELFHNFTLIHDDIEDDSHFRRGEPALHVKFGIPLALNTGDALYTLLWKKLVCMDLSPSRVLKLQRLYVDSFKRVVDGQGVEIEWIRSGRLDVSESEYLEMISGKTSALMGLSCEVGAFMAKAPMKVRRALKEYGEFIGAAFQVQDDVLNLTGDFEKYKKEIGGDISEGKRTLMVVHCLNHATEDKKNRLKSILSSHTKKEYEIKEAISIMAGSSSIDFAKKRAEDLVKKAKSRLMKLPDSMDKETLITLADYVISRQR